MPQMQDGAKQLKFRSWIRWFPFGFFESWAYGKGWPCFPKFCPGPAKPDPPYTLWVATANIPGLWMVLLALRFYVWRGATVSWVLSPWYADRLHQKVSFGPWSKVCRCSDEIKSWFFLKNAMFQSWAAQRIASKFVFTIGENEFEFK
jgi:hypothetical protein